MPERFSLDKVYLEEEAEAEYQKLPVPTRATPADEFVGASFSRPSGASGTSIAALRTAQLRRSFRHDSITKPPLASLCALCLLSVAPPQHAQSAQAARPAPTPVPAVLSLSHGPDAIILIASLFKWQYPDSPRS